MFNRLSERQAANEAREIETDVLKLRGQTLIVQDTVYPIRNIASLDILNFSTVDPFPMRNIIIGVVGVIVSLLLPDDLKILVVIPALWIAWVIYTYTKNRVRPGYGLRIITNAGIGNSSIILSRDVVFLRNIVLTLINVIGNDQSQNINFYLDKRNIQKVNMSNISGSTIVTGKVQGDIANSA
jgi:hypothetical protein